MLAMLDFQLCQRLCHKEDGCPFHFKMIFEVHALYLEQTIGMGGSLETVRPKVLI